MSRPVRHDSYDCQGDPTQCLASGVTSAQTCAMIAMGNEDCEGDYIEYRDNGQYCFCNPKGHTWVADLSYAGSTTYPISSGGQNTSLTLKAVGADGSRTVVDCDSRIGRYVYVTLPGKDKILSLCEVDVKVPESKLPVEVIHSDLLVSGPPLDFSMLLCRDIVGLLQAKILKQTAGSMVPLA